MFDRPFTHEEYISDYELKTKALELALGEKNEITAVSFIPFYLGGPFNMNLFSKDNDVKGCAFVTMELIEPDGSGPLPNQLGTYELIAFTRLEAESGNDYETPFGKMLLQMRGTMSIVGRFALENVLNPLETFEIENDEGENIFLFFTKYKDFRIGNRTHHLLACIEIFKSELDFAREETIIDLIEKLKTAGHYPYSDLDRQPVV